MFDLLTNVGGILFCWDSPHTASKQGSAELKVDRGSEDAFFVSNYNGGVLAIADVWNYPLQFEWAWQHPRESLAVRKVAASFKSLSGIANKIKLAYTMLTLPAWENLNLTINFFSTKHMKYTAGCPTLPQQKNVQFGSMDDLPCYMGSQILDQEEDFEEDEDCNEDELETNTMDISNREC
ncbi:structure-specific endonuclease subunit slx1 [Cinnamomum micranthum f. kanehirae]|uniref:Structure-specific endonuclease subunit slx1 n=1 Tax=Cinnamomum micranthum f. kanehirae TaxID=337451 RepID=A0A3S3NBX3_9MAGN|nr:structure-specific endonuclease subunit slx1 [Cinnamomum micranthum f. kanehirae]